jgi:hypothetical protein
VECNSPSDPWTERGGLHGSKNGKKGGEVIQRGRTSVRDVVLHNGVIALEFTSAPFAESTARLCSAGRSLAEGVPLGGRGSGTGLGPLKSATRPAELELANGWKASDLGIPA